MAWKLLKGVKLSSFPFFVLFSKSNQINKIFVGTTVKVILKLPTNRELTTRKLPTQKNPRKSRVRNQNINNERGFRQNDYDDQNTLLHNPRDAQTRRDPKQVNMASNAKRCTQSKLRLQLH